MKMTMVFIDGLGVGSQGHSNPFCEADLPCWHRLVDQFGFYSADASLDVPGLPQSATGQTSIYTGENAPGALGRHFSSRPTETLVRMIEKKNLFTLLQSRGYRVTFANVYSVEYLKQMNEKPRGIHKPSVTTLMSLSAGIPFRLIDDYIKGDGVYHDITGEGLREKGYDVPIISPETAAENLYRISREYDLTLFEFFLSDLAGHSTEMKQAIHILERFDRFIAHFLAKLDLMEEALVIVSDHGNIEDLSTSGHTLNPVPVFFITRREEVKAVEVKAITDILSAVLLFFPKKEQ